MKYSQEYVERLAKGKEIVSLTIHYFGHPQAQQKPEPVEYSWEDRGKIFWHKVRRCRLNWAEPKYYIIDGDYCKRPGFRV